MEPYLRHLLRAHRAEVFGEASYGLMRRLSRSPHRREKLRLLCRLETETKEKLRHSLSLAGIGVKESLTAKWLGGAAVVLVPLPWSWEMRILAAIVARTVPAFERFERDFGDRDPELARHLSAHERAQLDFFRREALGDGARSLDSVRALLG